ncbi:MAG TPA: TrkA C-terminal domain-containing protein [Victivallales bacterium]|nr:TrkA C-terminal domain-containing protein [Victivallales bacterium]
MDSLFLFLLTILVVIVVVRIGAVAFELTGMSWSQAKFQALSCFTLTGFTTREAESIINHPGRKRIASLMMVFGYAGSVSLFATFVNFLGKMFNSNAHYKHIPFLNIRIPSFVEGLLAVLLLIIVLGLIYRFFFRTKLWVMVTLKIRDRMKKSSIVNPATFESMLIGETEYGIIRIFIDEHSLFCNKTIKNSGFKESIGAQILTIERNNKAIPNPKADEKILQGDILYCFGKRKNLK